MGDQAEAKVANTQQLVTQASDDAMKRTIQDYEARGKNQMEKTMGEANKVQQDAKTQLEVKDQQAKEKDAMINELNLKLKFKDDEIAKTAADHKAKADNAMAEMNKKMQEKEQQVKQITSEIEFIDH